MNKYQNDSKEDFETQKIDEKSIENQLNRLKIFKENRDTDNVKNCLDSIRKNASKKNINLMPFIIEAIESKATLGEISDALRDIFGVHQ